MSRVRTAAALTLLIVALLSPGPAAASPWPVATLPVFARTAPGITKSGPFTEPTKHVGFGESVTWRFATDPILAWQSLTIERAEMRADRTWGAFTKVDTVVIDDAGVAYYATASAGPRTVSIRALFPASPSMTTRDSRSPARLAVWVAAPPRPLPLTAGTAIGPSTTFTTTAKVVALGQTVTWRWIGPARAAHQWAAVWIAERAPSGLWGPFVAPGVSDLIKSDLIQFDARGVATFRAQFDKPTWIAVKIYLPAGSPPVPETWSVALQGRWR